jgi:DNA mismatch repair protein PMS2
MKSGDIKKIDKASIIQLCSSQVVIDLKSAVKELVENSLDAGAKNIGKLSIDHQFIDIKFYNYGLQGFEVVDDGSGIKEVDFDILAKRGTTSKISEFDDIYAVKTMGFRGEALSSLCNIANLTIQTKQASQSTGWFVKFNRMGDVLSKEQMAKKVSVFFIMY